MKRKRMLTLIAALIVLFSQFLSAPAVSQEFCGGWQWVNGLQSGENMCDVLYAGEKYWAVGYHGTIMSSEDGLTWQRKQRVTNAYLLDITFNGEFFIAYGEYPSVILKSYDGEEWTAYEIYSLFGCQKIEWVNDKFIAIQALYPSMKILVSTDGVSWAESFSLTFDEGTNPYLRGIQANQGEIIVYGHTETYDQNIRHNKTYLISSYNGSNWTVKSTIDDFVVSSMSFNGTDYIITGGNKIFRSKDLINLDVDYEYGPDSHSCFISSFWNGQSFYALSGPNTRDYISYNPYGEHHVYQSSENGTWSEIAILPSPAIYSMIFSNGRFVAVGGLGHISVSEDGIEWQIQRPFAYATFYDAAYFKNNFLVAGNDWLSDEAVIFASPNGTDWMEVFRFDWRINFIKLTTNKKICVAAGESGYLFKSNNGMSFEKIFQPQEYTIFKDVAISDSGMVAAVGNNGNSGVIVSISEKGSPRQHLIPEAAEIYSIACDGKIFAAVGKTADGELIFLKSSDGKTWKTKHLKKSYRFYPFFPLIRYGAGKFITAAINEYDTIYFLTSSDGRTWKRRPFEGVLSNNKFLDVKWCGDYFFGVLDYNSDIGSAGYSISSDGAHWSLYEASTTFTINGIAAHGSTFLQAGEASSVLIATCPH